MIIFGRNTLREAIAKEWPLDEIRIAAGSQKDLRDFVRLAGQRGIPLKTVNKRELSRWADTDAHQGVAAIAREPREMSLDELLDRKGDAYGAPADGPLLLLDGVEDPRNFGAILRTALAAGAEGVVVTKDRSAPMSPAAIKASSGAAFFLPVARVTNLARAMDELKQRNYWTFGATPDAAQDMYKMEWARRSAIVIGGEGRGMRSLVRKKCDTLFYIPLNPQVESLNVSVAAGIILFEFQRVKGGCKKLRKLDKIRVEPVDKPFS